MADKKEYPEDFVRKVRAEYPESGKNCRHHLVWVWLDFGFESLGDLLKEDAFVDIPALKAHKEFNSRIGLRELCTDPARQLRILELYKEWYDLSHEMFRGWKGF